MVPIGVNTCFFNDHSLYLVNRIEEKLFDVSTIYKDIPWSGYWSGMEERLFFCGWFNSNIYVDSSVFFRIKKLFNLNYVACKQIILGATPSEDFTIKVFEESDGIIYISSRYKECFQISIHNLGFAPILHVHSTGFIKCIDNQTYNRLKEEIYKLKTIIDGIWQRKSL